MKCDLDFASNANELIDKARSGGYGLILTDNDMEDGHVWPRSGTYAIGEIRKFDTKTPTLLHSGCQNGPTRLQ